MEKTFPKIILMFFIVLVFAIMLVSIKTYEYYYPPTIKYENNQKTEKWEEPLWTFPY